MADATPLREEDREYTPEERPDLLQNFDIDELVERNRNHNRAQSDSPLEEPAATPRTRSGSAAPKTPAKRAASARPAQRRRPAAAANSVLDHARIHTQPTPAKPKVQPAPPSESANPEPLPGIPENVTETVTSPDTGASSNPAGAFENTEHHNGAAKRSADTDLEEEAPPSKRNALGAGSAPDHVATNSDHFRELGHNNNSPVHGDILANAQFGSHVPSDQFGGNFDDGVVADGTTPTVDGYGGINQSAGSNTSSAMLVDIANGQRTIQGQMSTLAAAIQSLQQRQTRLETDVTEQFRRIAIGRSLETAAVPVIGSSGIDSSTIRPSAPRSESTESAFGRPTITVSPEEARNNFAARLSKLKSQHK